MRSVTVRSMLVAGIAASVLLLVAPLESKACEWLWPWNWCRRPAATYAAPACAPCAPTCAPCAPQACYYMPQTSYRTTYRYVTSTTCQPVSSCDPCTGCAVTAYRPVTSVVLRPALVPYRSYRIVYAPLAAPACSTCPSSCGPCASYAPSCASGACGVAAPSCASGSCGVSGVISAPLSTGSGCSSCAASAAPSTVVPGPATQIPSLPSGPAASAPSVLQGPSSSNGSPSAPPATFAPSQSAPSTGGGSAAAPAAGSSTMLRRYWSPNTYTGPTSRPSTTTVPMPKVEPSVKPIPEVPASPTSGTAPQLTPPTNNKTASGLIRQAVYVTTPAAPVAAPQTQPAVDPYDWHASSN